MTHEQVGHNSIALLDQSGLAYRMFDTRCFEGNAGENETCSEAVE